MIGSHSDSSVQVIGNIVSPFGIIGATIGGVSMGGMTAGELITGTRVQEDTTRSVNIMRRVVFI